jgi:hypothetical protein
MPAVRRTDKTAATGRRQLESRSSLAAAERRVASRPPGLWGRRHELWEQRFGELLTFKALTGHTAFPRPFPAIPSSGTGVVQRQFRRQGKLSATRIARLDAVGFAWEESNRAFGQLAPRRDASTATSVPHHFRSGQSRAHVAGAINSMAMTTPERTMIAARIDKITETIPTGKERRSAVDDLDALTKRGKL